MSETVLNTSSQSQPDRPRRFSFSKARRNAAAIIAAGAVAGGTVAGVELSGSSSERPLVAGDAPYWVYGSFTPPKGHLPEPQLTKSPQGVVEKIQFNKTSNPAEVAQEVLQLIESGELPNQVWNGAVVLQAGTVLNRSPRDHNTMPSLPSRETADITVPEGQVLLVQRPRIFRDVQTGQTWLIANEAASSEKSNTARDVSQTYWIDITKDRNAAVGYVYSNSDPDRDYSLSRTIDVKVNQQGNLQVKEGATHGPLATFSEVPQTDLANQLGSFGLLESKYTPN